VFTDPTRFSDPTRDRTRDAGPHRLPEVYVLRLEGEVDVARRPELAALADAFVASGATSARLLVPDVAFMDSSGLQLIARLHRAARLRGGTVQIVDPAPAVLRIIEVSGLDALVEVHRSDR
jgi:stage II sporulation protein AA (anti-sigma F factor antagonist)